jgi:4-amino-4-deoxy-L-arabinose transferase-like glycosyltransferase
VASPSAEAIHPGGTSAGRLGIAVVCLLLAGVWFLTLDWRHLLPSDEGRYAEIAREMLASGDWVTIRYNGVKYFEKPPFQMWMTALAFQAFGIGEWQARLWVALSGALGVVMTAVAARRWFGPRVALLSALILVAAPAWNLASHFNSLDMGCRGRWPAFSPRC